MEVSNMLSSRGNTVPNQFIIIDGDRNTTWFQSYKTMIAKKHDGQLFMDRDAWDYSVTTARYRNLFTGLTTSETKAGIDSGEIKLVDLNR